MKKKAVRHMIGLPALLRNHQGRTSALPGVAKVEKKI
jgi:hypothetical protein